MKDQKEYEQKLKAAEETLGAVQSCVKGAQTFLEASSQNKDAMIANLEKSVAVHIDTTATLRKELNAMKTTIERPNEEIAANNKEISKLSQRINYITKYVTLATKTIVW